MTGCWILDTRFWSLATGRHLGRKDKLTMGLDFDSLTELMADLKSIDAQLGSARPKTAIIRACLHSISGVVKGTTNSSLYGRISGLLGE